MLTSHQRPALAPASPASRAFPASQSKLATTYQTTNQSARNIPPQPIKAFLRLRSFTEQILPFGVHSAPILNLGIGGGKDQSIREVKWLWKTGGAGSQGGDGKHTRMRGKWGKMMIGEKERK